MMQTPVSRPAGSGQRRTRWLVALAGALALCAAIPASAGASSNIGGGVVTGTVSFAGSGVPPFFQPCAPSSFTLNVSSNGTGGGGVVLNTAGTEYVGTVNISGNGSSTCESASLGGGTLTLTSVQGTGPNGGTLNCADPSTGTTLSGNYTRVYTDVTALLHGSCIINDFSAPVTFVFKGEFAPTSAGQGVTQPITSATFAGPFTVMPL